MSFVLHKNLDFVQLSSRGMHVLSLGSLDKRAFKNDQGKEICLHPLDQYQFLKQDSSNFLRFNCSVEDDLIISIKQEYKI
jgi:hypothetical protein